MLYNNNKRMYYIPTHSAQFGSKFCKDWKCWYSLKLKTPVNEREIMPFRNSCLIA